MLEYTGIQSGANVNVYCACALKPKANLNVDVDLIQEYSHRKRNHAAYHTWTSISSTSSMITKFRMQSFADKYVGDSFGFIFFGMSVFSADANPIP